MHRFRVVVLLGLWGSFAQAGPVNVYCSGPVRVALFEYGVLYRGSTSDGIDAKLLDVLEKRTGCTLTRVVLPRNRIWAELQSGTLDMATAAIPTPERRAYAYLLPYFQTRNFVLMRKAGAAQPLTMAEFEAGTQRMAVVRGFRHETDYDAMVVRMAAAGRVVESVDVVDNLRMLDKGVVDVVLSQPVVFRQYLDETQLKTKFLLRDWIAKDQSSVGGLILARQSFTPEQARRWDGLLASLLHDGTVEKIYRKFLSRQEAHDALYVGPRSPD